MLFFDPTYLLCMAPAFLLMVITSIYVKSAYNKWSQVPAHSRMTGSEAVQRLIARAGLYGIKIEGVRGNLTDNYDPRTKVLHLSQDVAGNASVASLAVAAHELGHAQQDAEGYFPLRFRAALVPMVNIGSYLGWILIIIGLILKLRRDGFGSKSGLAGCGNICRRGSFRPGNLAGGIECLRPGARLAGRDWHHLRAGGTTRR